MAKRRATNAIPLLPADDPPIAAVLPDEAVVALDRDLPARDPFLALQHMEAALVRADLAHPGALTDEQFRRLRYLISFARLNVFEPGAAGPNGTRGRGDVSVGEELAPFRQRVLDLLHDPLRVEPDRPARLRGAVEVLETLSEPLGAVRLKLAERHADEFSLDELDAEVGYKALVCVLGGGGGAGYVYIGGMLGLVEEGLMPAYMLGSSFGSIVGGIVSRTLPIPIEEYVQWAKTVTYKGILGPETFRRTHGLPGLMSLKFNRFADDLFRREDGERMRLKDCAIPYESVVAGVRKQSFDRLPRVFRRAEMAALQMGSLPLMKFGMAPFAAARLWQVAAFIDSRVVKPIVMGSDDLTANLNLIDAIGFSCAIPGVLHHESSDPAMIPLLNELMATKDVAALVDGGAASNVPVELAYKRIADGRIGTRNACFFAWDCFHPQWDPKHLWLQPVTQAIKVQMIRNAPFADRIVQFSPTLSPLTLAAAEPAIDRAVDWGKASVAESLPFIKRLVEPVWWEGDSAPGAGRPSVEVGAPVSPMETVIDAARYAAEQLTARGRFKRAAEAARQAQLRAKSSVSETATRARARADQARQARASRKGPS